MHKLILSIIAVALLQIGFITYVTSDKTADNAGIYNAPAFTPTASPTTDEESIEVASLDEDPFFRRETPNPGSDRTARSARSDYLVRRKSKRAPRKIGVQNTPFVAQDVIITYAVHKPYKFVEREPYRNFTVYSESTVNKSEMPEQPVIKPHKSDRNPILSVIKKPYTWIKALGSKLK